MGILKKLIRSNPEIYNLLGKYISELLYYKGIEIPVINEYINDRGESMLAQSMDKLYEQGIEQGIERDKRGTAERMLAKGFSVEDVSEITTLKIEVVEQLREEKTDR